MPSGLAAGEEAGKLPHTKENQPLPSLPMSPFLFVPIQAPGPSLEETGISSLEESIIG